MTLFRTLLGGVIAIGLIASPAWADRPRDQDRAFEATRHGRSMPLPQIERPQHPRTQIVPVAETAGDHQHRVVLYMPFAAHQLVHGDDFGRAACQFTGQHRVAVAVTACGVEDEDGFGGFVWPLTP